MKIRLAVALSGFALLVVGCATKDATSPQTQTGVRIVNAYGQPVDVLVDGVLAAQSVPPGQLDTVPQSAGSHAVSLRAAGVTAPALQVKTVTGAVATVAALRLSGVLAASALDDTNAVVPSGATKVRVLHLAPNAGEIQVFRTQPDWGIPIEWQFPFLYDSVITSMGNPYLQSTVGTWDVRAWMKPSEVGLGWAGTTAHVTVTLASGQKRTVLVLDKPGGGIELSVID